MKENLFFKIIIGILIFSMVSIILVMNTLERLEERLMPTFAAMSDIKVNQEVNVCIDDVITMLQDAAVYQPSDFYTVSYDQNGNVSLIENNSILINKVTKDIASNLDNELSDIGDVEMELRIFDVLYPEAFDNLGPIYKMQMLKDGYSNVSYKSEMVEISGNQTNFKAYIEIEVNIRILSPLYTNDIVVTREVLIVDSIISSKNAGLKIK